MRKASILLVVVSSVASFAACASTSSSSSSGAAPEREGARPSKVHTPVARRAREVTIGGSGDVLVHIKVIRSAREHPEEGFRHVFSELGQVIRPDEVAFVNLETPLSERIPAETGSPPTMGAPADVAPALAAAGVDVASCANNHAYDQSAAGLADTMTALEGAHITAVGCAATEQAAAGPVLVVRDGVRIAFLGYTVMINKGPLARPPSAYIARYDVRRAAEAVRQAHEIADLVVLSVHWSNDFITHPYVTQRRDARILVEAGADLILGHGPHVLQEVERFQTPRGEAVCAYSLGNLVSNQGLRWVSGRRYPEDMPPAVILPTVRDGVWFRVRFSLEDRVRVLAIEGVPLWTHNNFLRVARREEELLDIRVRPLRAVEPELRAERLPVIAEDLGDVVRLLE